MGYIRLRKTPHNKRLTYKCIDEHGKTVCEISPGVDGVTELDIYNCHKVDDMEVYRNCKMFRPHYAEWLQSSVDDWKMRRKSEFAEKAGRAPLKGELAPYEHLVSLDECIERETDGNGYNLLAEELLRQEKTEPPEIERLHELVASMPLHWQEIYRHSFVECIPTTKIAEERGVTEGAVRKTIGKIRERIAKDELLQKLFNGEADPEEEKI